MESSSDEEVSLDADCREELGLRAAIGSEWEEFYKISAATFPKLREELQVSNHIQETDAVFTWWRQHVNTFNNLRIAAATLFSVG